MVVFYSSSNSNLTPAEEALHALYLRYNEEFNISTSSNLHGSSLSNGRDNTVKPRKLNIKLTSNKSINKDKEDIPNPPQLLTHSISTILEVGEKTLQSAPNSVITHNRHQIQL